MKERRGVHRVRRGSGTMGLDIMGRGGSHLAGDIGGEKQLYPNKRQEVLGRENWKCRDPA